MSYTLHANTPEQAKVSIVQWLQHQASNYRISANRATLVRTKKRDEARASAYQDAADFLEKATLEPLIIN